MTMFRGAWVMPVALLAAAACRGGEEAAATTEVGAAQAARAVELAHRFIIMDGHVDVPDRLNTRMEDISRRTEHGDFDYPRAIAGGLDAPFMSIYVPSEFQTKGGARALADQLIDMMEKVVAQHPDKFALARSPDQVVANSKAGRISLPFGIENGAAIEDDLRNLAHFHERGVRYITLTHAKDNLICDSSYDKAHTWKGLSPFGRQVVAEMNRLGIMVDVSHISDQAFDQVIDLVRAPVIASHSSARHFTPGFERNLDDERIRKLAAKGGVILVNFGSSFIDQRARDSFDAMREAVAQLGRARTPRVTDRLEREAVQAAYAAQHPPRFATVDQVADHIQHIIALVGVDHVGLGSDFDGVGDSLPIGLKDVSAYPSLIAVLLARGLSEADIEKVCGGNFLRVWREVEAHAAAAARSSPG